MTPGSSPRPAPVVELDVDSSATVGAVMRLLEAKPGPPADTVLFSYNNEDLWDLDTTLGEVGIADGACLDCNVHPDFRGCG